MCRISKPGVREMSNAGRANRISRVIELLADKFNGKSRPKDWKIRGKAGGTVAAVCDRRNS